MRPALLALLAAASLATTACSKPPTTQAAAGPNPVEAGSAGIPDGHYGCLFAAGGSPGYVDIRGDKYRGPSQDGGGSFANYRMGPNNAVTWSAGFGEFSVVSTAYRGVSNDSDHKPWFTVTYNRTSGGGVDSVDCEKE